MSFGTSQWSGAASARPLRLLLRGQPRRRRRSHLADLRKDELLFLPNSFFFKDEEQK